MITFHSRQLDCDRRVRKNESTGTINFTSQITSSICMVMITMRVQPDATNFTSRCSRTAVSYRFRGGQALPLSKVRFSRLANGSPANRPNPTRRSRNGREPSGKKSGEVSRSILHDFQTIADIGQCNSAAFPRDQFGRQLASWRATRTQCSRRSSGKSRCNIPRNIPQTDSLEFFYDV